MRQYFDIRSRFRKEAKTPCFRGGSQNLSLPLRNYLGSVLPGMADFPSNRGAELLTPNAWAAKI
jgi:hypothetical protein